MEALWSIHQEVDPWEWRRAELSVPSPSREDLIKTFSGLEAIVNHRTLDPIAEHRDLILIVLLSAAVLYATGQK